MTEGSSAVIACPVCGAAGRSLRAVEGWAVRLCSDSACRHSWLRDPPGEAALAAFYDTQESALWNSGAFSILEDYRADPEALARYYRRERFDALARALPEVAGRPGAAVLDVGCATGVFLATLRARGFEVAGQELSPASARAAREIGIEVCAAPLEECDFGRRFDLITAYDVIEHLRDPRALLRRLRRLVRDDGAVAVRTPNHASWLRALTGRRWLWYLPPAHLHHFSAASLASLAAQEGFEVARVATGSTTYLFLLAHYLLPARARGPEGNVRLAMPRWQERLLYGLDRLARIGLAPLTVPAGRLRANPLVTVYLRPGRA